MYLAREDGTLGDMKPDPMPNGMDWVFVLQLLALR